MSELRHEQMAQLQIAPEKRTRRRQGPIGLVAGILVLLVVIAIVYVSSRRQSPAKAANTAALETAVANAPAAPPQPGESILTVSGYVIPRERIEISPKFMGTVVWIGVKKGDQVKQGDVIVRLDDAEYRARLAEAEGRFALAVANRANGEINLKRALELSERNVDSQQAVDDARRARDAAAAEVKIAEGQRALAQTYLDWCTIRAPIDGVVLEKLVDPNELVVPQSFGGSGGPSTAFVAMADLKDLQVEVDLSEADTPKVYLQQLCRVSPEAYPDKIYTGRVAEIAPEANRSKGTLQVKVQVEKPDQYLTPELTAKVDFLAE